jgi:hypothetical protein
VLFLALFLISTFATLDCVAQVMPATSKPVQVDTVSSLRDSLQEKMADRARLERMLEALNTVDTVYKAHCPTWKILDEDLKQRLFRVFQMRFAGTIQDTDIVVIANPQETQILELQAGQLRMGRRDVRVSLGDSLTSEILQGNYSRRQINTNLPPPRNPLLFGYAPRFAALSISAFEGTLLFSDSRGIDVKLGHEEIGYHFWSTGSLQIMAVLEQLRVGIVAPFTFGNIKPGLVQPLTIRPRLLSGEKGIVLHYDTPDPSEQLSAHFTIGEIRGVTNPSLLVGDGAIYSVHTVAQITYARQDLLSQGSHLFTLKGGIGYHQIAAGAVTPDGLVGTTEKDDFFSPILGVDYVHQGERLYGMGIQYYSSIIFAKCWVELVKDFIFVDVKYYAPVVRNAKPWEQPYFFMVSPRLQVVY